MLDFLDAGKNPERDTQGLALKTAATGPSPTTAEPGQPQAQSTGETQGAASTQPTSDSGRNQGTGDPSEEQRQKESRDFWNKWKGLPTHTPEERAQQRVEYAKQQAENNSQRWLPEPYGYIYNYNKCNEFVYDTHSEGDPGGYNFPTVQREGGYIWNWILQNDPLFKPTVRDMANPNFATDKLEFYINMNNAKPGDAVIWYQPESDTHHSGIYIGDGRVIHATSEGVKESDMSDVLPRVSPIFRRLK